MADQRLIPSPYGTIGPFFPRSFVENCDDLTVLDGRTAQGEKILLTGRVFEEGPQGEPVPTLNTIVEIWQPDANGIFRNPLDPRFAEADPGFCGWGRARTDAQGRYRFTTVFPGSPMEPDGTRRCPHLNLMLLAIGLTRRLVTTVFFSPTPQEVSDPVLDCVARERRMRLFATRNPELDKPNLLTYRFDIVMRGHDETPFFLD